jgi:hypothetical protein
VRDTLYNSLVARRALNTTAISADGNTDGPAVGLDQSGQDFKVAMFVALAGDITDGVFTCVPQESPNGSTGWADVPPGRVQGSAVLDADHEVAEVGVIPDASAAPFLRLRVTATEVTTGGPVAAVLLLGSPSQEPVVR